MAPLGKLIAKAAKQRSSVTTYVTADMNSMPFCPTHTPEKKKSSKHTFWVVAPFIHIARNCCFHASNFNASSEGVQETFIRVQTTRVRSSTPASATHYHQLSDQLLSPILETSFEHYGVETCCWSLKESRSL